MSNLFFAKQCTHIETGSSVPAQLLRRTNESLNIINFIEDDILNVKRNLDPIVKQMDMIKSALAWCRFVTKQFANDYI